MSLLHVSAAPLSDPIPVFDEDDDCHPFWD
jgi:hypothetical protein